MLSRLILPLLVLKKKVMKVFIMMMIMIIMTTEFLLCRPPASQPTYIATRKAGYLAPCLRARR